MKRKRTAFTVTLILAALTTGITIGCASAPQAGSAPVLGPPTLLQQALNLVPAVPIAGNNLKFQFGGDVWIANNNNKPFMAGISTVHDTGEASYLLLKQTHIQAPVVGWIVMSGPEIIFEYTKGPPASLKIISRPDLSESVAQALDAGLPQQLAGQSSPADSPAQAQPDAQPAPAGSRAQAQAGGQVTPAAYDEAEFSVQIINNGASVRITTYLGTRKDVVIPPAIGGRVVTEIGDEAFTGKGLTGVVIPGGVSAIGRMAFAGNQIDSVTIGPDVAIDPDAFDNADFIAGYNSQGRRPGTYGSNWRLLSPEAAQAAAAQVAAAPAPQPLPLPVPGTEGGSAQVQESAGEPATAQVIPTPVPKNPKLWTLGASVGTSFSSPWFIGTVHGTLAPLKFTFFEIGMDIGLVSGAAAVDYFSLYPFVHFAAFVPFKKRGGWYIGLGCGNMFAHYTFYYPAETVQYNSFAFEVITGFNIMDIIDLSYTLRTNFSGVSNKVTVGYTYRFR